MELYFEWDEEKAKTNLNKHGVSFEMAAKVFFDQNRIEIYDDAHSHGDEDRFITIGMAGESFICSLHGTPAEYPVDIRTSGKRKREEAVLWYRIR